MAVHRTLMMEGLGKKLLEKRKNQFEKHEEITYCDGGILYAADRMPQGRKWEQGR